MARQEGIAPGCGVVGAFGAGIGAGTAVYRRRAACSISVIGVQCYSAAFQGWELQTVNPWLGRGQKVSF